MHPDRSHANVTYRPEIDGLRALAVLPVILFHAGLPAFKGGFVGVDVFFVISGYLITSIIAGDCRAGRFSLARFYERRARRILPALFVVTAACLPFAWSWMLPVETLNFTRSELATLAFVPNVYFWLKTSYFGTPAGKLPLLHTWSLGVEEQFYLLFPLLLVFIWRFGTRIALFATLALALVSFGLSEWAWRAGKFSSSFFLPPTRAWELMLGALIALASQSRPVHERLGKRTAQALSLAGLALLAFSVFWFDEKTPTPSAYALMPVGGTALMIACAGPDTLVRRALSNRVLVGVGLISYSAYLWHQPLFAFARLHATGEPSVWILLALGALSLLLAYLTWRFVETPFRHARIVPRPALVKSLLACWVALLAVGLASEGTKGFDGRIDPKDESLAALADTEAQGRYVLKRFSDLDRDFSNDGRRTPHVLIIGDSFAEDLTNALFEGGGERLSAAQLRTYYVSADCQIYFGTTDVSQYVEREFRPECQRVRASPALQRRAAEADIVILAGSWMPWAARLLPETLQWLKGTTRGSLYVVGPKRVGDINIHELLDEPYEQRIRHAEPVSEKVLELERLLAQAATAGSYVSMQAALCGTGPQCRLFSPEGSLLSYDGVHLTREGAAWAGRRLLTESPLATALAFAAPDGR